MGLPLRLTFKDKDYIYQINDSHLIDRTTNEIDLTVNGEPIKLARDNKNVWMQKNGDLLNPELIQALGRSVSLRLRL